MKTWDVVIVGGGIIGVSLALGLRRSGAKVLVIDRGEPGREATHAAAGMLAHCEQHPLMTSLATASAGLYPEFVREIEEESGSRIDYRTEGTILFLSGNEDEPFCEGGTRVTPYDLQQLEPRLAYPEAGAAYLPEASVDPRGLIGAAVKAARRRGVDISSGTEVTAIEVNTLGVGGVSTAKTRYPARVVVNCAGAWSGRLAGPTTIPTRPIKGHMLDVIPAQRLVEHGTPQLPAARSASEPGTLLRRVVRSADVYLVPRGDGRIVIGSTVEDVGFDKRVVSETIQRLHQAAANLMPDLGEARIHESWTGLRPGSPDGLPLLGATSTPGYFVATGHFRDGILLAPVTARVMTQIIASQQPDHDLSPFSPLRFNSGQH